jgi:cell division transport system permease protein
MLTSFKRIIRYGLIDFWRNSFVSLSSVFVMTVTLFAVGSMMFLQATLESTLFLLRDKVDVNVYFTTAAPEGDILDLKNKIEGLPEVARVEYISRDSALVNFRERHENDQLTLQALDELGENPLGAVLNIKAAEPSQYEGVARFLESQQTGAVGSSVSIIDKINFFQNKTAIDRLASVIGATERLGAAITIILIALSVLITFNTIRLAIFTAREEIAVKRLVGASNTFIRGPFMVQGILSGMAAAIIALALFYPLTYWLGPMTQNFFSGLNLFTYYVAHMGEMAMIIVGSGILLGSFSSFLAVKKYLKI